MREIADAQKDLGGDASGAKVAELSKKVRDLNLQVGKDRTAMEKLKKELDEYKRGNGGGAPKSFKPGEMAATEDAMDTLRKENKSLREKNHSVRRIRPRAQIFKKFSLLEEFNEF